MMKWEAGMWMRMRAKCGRWNGWQFIETKKTSEREREKKNYGWNSTAFTCTHRLRACSCVHVEQQSKDPHILKFKFQQFTWIYHEIQFMAMFLVFSVHITKSLVPNTFSLVPARRVCACVCACYSVSLTYELLAIYLGYRCAPFMCAVSIWMGNVCTLRMPALMCIDTMGTRTHTQNRIMCEREQQKNCTTIQQVMGA